MKKIYLTLGLGALILGANAQQKMTQVLTAKSLTKEVSLTNGALLKTTAASTLTPPTFTAGGCATNTANIVYYNIFSAPQATTSYTVQSAGYAFGTNRTTYTLSTALATQAGTPTVTDIVNRAAQKYSVTGSANVTNVIVYSAIAEGTGMVTAKVYSENATTKAPNAQIGTSATKVLSSFTPGSGSIMTFGTPVPLTTGKFFVSVESPAMGGAGMDTLALLSTSAGCATTDSLSWNFDVVSPPIFAGGWSSVKSAFGANLDLMIFPVIDITTGLSTVSKGDLTLMAAFPNPATNDVSINFGLTQSGKVQIDLYDLTGKTVNTIKLDNLENGNHTTKVDVSNLSAGVYMYSVKSESTKMYSKFTVTK